MATVDRPERKRETAREAVRVNDDDQSDGMGAAGYVVVILIVVGLSLLIATVLWLPEIYRAVHGRGLWA